MMLKFSLLNLNFVLVIKCPKLAQNRFFEDNFVIVFTFNLALLNSPS